MNSRHALLGISLTLVVLLSAVGCTSTSLASYADNEGRPATLALVNGDLIDGTGAGAIPNAVILIAGDKISAVGPRDAITIPDGVSTVDVDGATILPGFINAHVHFGFNEDNLKAWAHGGVTTVRDEGVVGSGWTFSKISAFCDKVALDPQYARLVSAGFMMTVPGGYGDLFVSSPEEARRQVLEELDSGVDLIKVSLEDGYGGRSGLPKLTPEELVAIVNAAHERGSRVSGHITQGAYLQPMVDAGVDDIAHVPYDVIPPDSLQQMADNGIYLVPTFTVLRNYGAPIRTCMANLHEFVELGGKVALGNDYGGGPGEFERGIPMYEIETMSGAGMTPMQIIVASTKHAAYVLNLGNEVGTLEPGKVADVLVVGGNPLEDLQALRDVRVVVHNGVIIRNEIEK
jgi:imidazolonepropionase-like amidohydrolase